MIHVYGMQEMGFLPYRILVDVHFLFVSMHTGDPVIYHSLMATGTSKRSMFEMFQFFLSSTFIHCNGFEISWRDCVPAMYISFIGHQVQTRTSYFQMYSPDCLNGWM